MKREEKWDKILQLYNQLLVIEYSPAAALNRTYALSKAMGKAEAIAEAEKLNLAGNYLYHCLLGYLYTDVDNIQAINNYAMALVLTKAKPDKAKIESHILQLKRSTATI
jgi:predicted RNA polymerase sigma factor